MKNEIKKSLTMSKINAKNNKITYIVLSIIFLCVLVSSIVDVAIQSKNIYIGFSNYIFLAVILTPIFVVTSNYKKFINIGAKKKDFFIGSIVFYVMLSFAVAILSTILYYTIDKLMLALNSNFTNTNIMLLANWMNNGVFVWFILQFFVLITVCVIVHSLTLIQNNWIGWMIDVVLIAIIAVFLPIPVLRNSLLVFFKLLLFNENYFIQILFNIFISSLIYFSTLLNLKSRKI